MSASELVVEEWRCARPGYDERALWNSLLVKGTKDGPVTEADLALANSDLGSGDRRPAADGFRGV